MIRTPVKYVAELTHVREVSLLGTANAAFWKDRLQAASLLPAESDARAQILIIAATGRFLGITFSELSFSVLVDRQGQEGRQDAAYLVHGYNSRRLLAFFERTVFATPYHQGDCCVSAAFPESIQIGKKGEVLFRAEMGAGAPARKRKPSRSEENGWEGPVFLPQSRISRNRQGNLFFARIRGHTRIYPFLSSEDRVTIWPSRDSEVLRVLMDSGFVGKEWAVREDATHARSKTYRISQVLQEPPAHGA